MSKPPTYSIRDLYPEKIEKAPVARARKELGWDFYSLWPEVDPAKTPRAMWMGLVLVI